MTHVTCRLTAKNRDQLRNPTLGNRVWASFFCHVPSPRMTDATATPSNYHNVTSSWGGRLTRSTQTNQFCPAALQVRTVRVTIVRRFVYLLRRQGGRLVQRTREGGDWKRKYRKRKVPEDGICKYGIRSGAAHHLQTGRPDLQDMSDICAGISQSTHHDTK